MTGVIGGLRNRLILKAFHDTVRGGLGELGWLDAGRAHTPLTIVARQFHLDEEVPINTVACSTANITPEDLELGSGLAEHVIEAYVDVYGENDSLAAHVADDVVALLSGRFSGVGRADPSIEVWNWSLATPVPIFVVQVEDVRRDRARDFPHPWQRHWYVARCELVDTYDDDYEPVLVGGGYAGGYAGGY